MCVGVDNRGLLMAFMSLGVVIYLYETNHCGSYATPSSYAFLVLL